MRLIFDAHLDLAWCAVCFNRDLLLPIEEIRDRERGMNDEPSRGRCVLSLPELRAAGVAVCVATLLARGGPNPPFRASIKRTDLDYAAPTLASAAAHAQLAYYRLLERQGYVRLIYTSTDLAGHWRAYERDPQHEPLGIILSMEGADPMLAPSDAEYWWQQGLRACGPAHYGRGQYAYGTGVDGRLGEYGIELLQAFRRTGILLDVTHLCETSFWEAMQHYDGPLLASHHNCRALVPGDRQLTDEQIKEVVGRGGVIGAALDAWMLVPGWERGVTQPDAVGLAAVVDQIDHVCQIAGSARHSALGTDLDGGFGNEQTPHDLRRYADLQQLDGLLAARGYSSADIDLIFHGNWLRFFGAALPPLQLA